MFDIISNVRLLFLTTGHFSGEESWHRFSSLTSNPLRQKRLRLQEARRLMLGEDLDAASAAYRVGYHDASHFNREYKSLFGVPPRCDVHRLREAAQVSAGR